MVDVVQAGQPQRTLIISRVRGYHGTNYGGTSAQGIAPNRENFGPLVGDVVQVPADDIEALASSTTVATLLPGAEFSTRAKYPDARRLLEAGITVALAADCNPGSSYTTNMPFCIAVAVRDMHMTPAQAVWSATAGGAAALQRTDVGSVRVHRGRTSALCSCPFRHSQTTETPGFRRCGPRTSP